MKKQKKGFSLVETLVALFIFAGLISVFGILMTKGIKMNKSGEKTHDVLNDGLIISERIYKNMRYTSANLVNIFPYVNNNNVLNNINKNECLAIGFPTISEGNYSTNTIDTDKTGYNQENYDCMDISKVGQNNFKKNWSQIKYDTSIYSFDTSKFYKEVLDYILLGKDDKIKIKNKNLLSKNIKSFKISTNSYPNFKMRVLLDYGTYGGNNIEGRRNTTIEKQAENFEMDWVVCPVN